MAALRNIRRSKRLLPLLLLKERRLRKKLAAEFKPRTIPREALTISRDVEVY
jgi:hypothetical protein